MSDHPDSEDRKSIKVDVSSQAVEKGLDLAKSFLDKLLLPSTEELGLLLRDQVASWRFKNQIKILNRAKAICERNAISLKAISPKLLCPYLESASLEDDDLLQDKWANLLVNMADSQQNIQNHVFPYVLSQLSKDEFTLLEETLAMKDRRVAALKIELAELAESRPQIERELQARLKALADELAQLSLEGKRYAGRAFEASSELMKIKAELRALDRKQRFLESQLSEPQSISESLAREFEIANIIRLGLAKVIYEASAGTHEINIPSDRGEMSSTSLSFDIEIDTASSTILTELGEMFIDACRERITPPGRPTTDK
jgi:hypothetical protein